MADEGNTFKHDLRLPNGTVQTYEASTQEELFQKIAAAHQASVNALKDREEQVRQRDQTIQNQTQQLSQFQQNQQAAREQQISATGGWTEAELQPFWKTAAGNPTEMVEKAIEKRYGIKLADMVDSVKELADLKRTINQSTAVSGFQNTVKDFNPTPENVQLMQNRINQLESAGHPMDAYTVQAAWDQLVREGVAEPARDEPEEKAQSRGSSAVPVTDTQRSSEELVTADFDNMSTEEMNEALRKQGFDIPV